MLIHVVPVFDRKAQLLSPDSLCFELAGEYLRTFASQIIVSHLSKETEEQTDPNLPEMLKLLRFTAMQKNVVELLNSELNTTLRSPSVDVIAVGQPLSSFLSLLRIECFWDDPQCVVLHVTSEGFPSENLSTSIH